jgi:hypothetical protein
VVYDARVESLRLIDGAAVAGAERLTRRHRFLPVAVDVADDIAVTVFLRRAHGGAEWQFHLLSRTSGGWQMLGGGGWGFDDLGVLTHTMGADELGGGPAQAGGGGSVWVSRANRPPSGARWLHYALIKTTAEVRNVTVAADRSIDRPAHGHIAVVWKDDPETTAAIVGQDGQVLCTVDLRAGRLGRKYNLTDPDNDAVPAVAESGAFAEYLEQRRL